jgi:hypothetical protein
MSVLLLLLPLRYKVYIRAETSANTGGDPITPVVNRAVTQVFYGLHTPETQDNAETTPRTTLSSI